MPYSDSEKIAVRRASPDALLAIPVTNHIRAVNFVPVTGFVMPFGQQGYSLPD